MQLSHPETQTLRPQRDRLHRPGMQHVLDLTALSELMLTSHTGTSLSATDGKGTTLLTLSFVSHQKTGSDLVQ